MLRSTSTSVPRRRLFLVVLLVAAVATKTATAAVTTRGGAGGSKVPETNDGPGPVLPRGRDLQAPSPPTANVVDIGFDDALQVLGEGAAIGSFYAGGSAGVGPDYGVTFGPDATVVHDPNKNSDGNATLALGRGPIPGAGQQQQYQSLLLNVVDGGGFTALSFVYGSFANITLVLYRGPNLTGPVLGTNVEVAATDQCGGSCAVYPGLAARFSLPPAVFSGGGAGAARSIGIVKSTGTAVLDDVIIVKAASASPVPTPAPSRCSGTTYYWVSNNAASNTTVGPLVNRTVTCLVHPYNIEVRTCSLPTSLPVTTRLVRQSDLRVVQRRQDYQEPFDLFGSSNSPGPLPDGKYYLSSTVGGGGRLAFTQSCPCRTKGTKGRRGCGRVMKRRRRRVASAP